jgi:hypothetical protein
MSRRTASGAVGGNLQPRHVGARLFGREAELRQNSDGPAYFLVVRPLLNKFEVTVALSPFGSVAESLLLELAFVAPSAGGNAIDIATFRLPSPGNPARCWSPGKPGMGFTTGPFQPMCAWPGGSDVPYICFPVHVSLSSVSWDWAAPGQSSSRGRMRCKVVFI